MDRYTKNLTTAAGVPKRSFASRLFDYEIFISFALGPPQRSTQSYASDLARRLFLIHLLEGK